MAFDVTIMAMCHPIKTTKAVILCKSSVHVLKKTSLALVEGDHYMFVMQVTIGTSGTKTALPLGKPNTSTATKDWMATAAQGEWLQGLVFLKLLCLKHCLRSGNLGLIHLRNRIYYWIFQ